jgi:hypothetical protein
MRLRAMPIGMANERLGIGISKDIYPSIERNARSFSGTFLELWFCLERVEGAILVPREGFIMCNSVPA